MLGAGDPDFEDLLSCSAIATAIESVASNASAFDVERDATSDDGGSDVGVTAAVGCRGAATVGVLELLVAVTGRVAGSAELEFDFEEVDC